MKHFFSILFLFCFLSGFSQLSPATVHAIDSLRQLIANTDQDTTRINYYKSWDDLIYASDPKLDLELNQKITALAEENLRKKTLQPVELKAYRSALAFGLNNIGLFYSDQGDNSKAIDYHIRSLKTSEELGDKPGVAKSLNNIGIIYKQQGFNSKAVIYFTRSLAMQMQIGNKGNMARCLNNIGLVYQNEKDYDQALLFLDSALMIRKQIGDKRGIASSMSNIGTIHLALKEYEKALKYQDQALAMMEKLADKPGISVALKDIGNIYQEMGDHTKAISYIQKALDLAKETGVVYEIKVDSKNLYDSYKKTGKHKEALEMYEYYILMRDSISNEQSKKDVMKQELQYNFEKQKALTEKEHEKQIAVHTEQEKKQKVISYAIAGGLVMVILFSFLLFNRLRVTRKQKNIIEMQKKLVEKQKLLVEHKQKEIIDSINYAKRIQHSQLPTETYIQRTINRLKK